MGGNVAGLQIPAVCRQISSQLRCFVVVVVEHRSPPSRGGGFVQTFCCCCCPSPNDFVKTAVIAVSIILIDRRLSPTSLRDTLSVVPFLFHVFFLFFSFFLLLNLADCRNSKEKHTSAMKKQCASTVIGCSASGFS